MANTKKQADSEEAQGAPEWMVTFSDCMTLLLTFFVLLLSFSSFDDKVHRQMRETMFMDLPSIYKEVKRERDAIAKAEHINPAKEIEKGSEKETLLQGPKGSLNQKKDASSFRDRKVFLISSDQIFWGKGTTISPDGINILNNLVRFLKQVSGKIVICESSSVNDQASIETGMARSWSVLDYMVSKQSFDPKRLSIATTSTIDETSKFDTNSRWLEFVILERSITN